VQCNFYIYDLCVLVASPWTAEPSLLIAGSSTHRVMNLRATLCVASFAIRVTSKIRSRHDFQYKFGRQEISQRDATGETTERHEGEGRNEEKCLLEFIVRYIAALRYCGMVERIRMG